MPGAEHTFAYDFNCVEAELIRQEARDRSVLLDDMKRGFHAQLVVAEANQIRARQAMQAMGNGVRHDGAGDRIMLAQPEFIRLLEMVDNASVHDPDYRKHLHRRYDGFFDAPKYQSNTLAVNGFRDDRRAQA